MPVSSSPFIDLIAKEVSDYMIKRGWWPDCNAEKILELAADYDELQQWRRESLAPDTEITELPSNPEEGQVALVDYGDLTYQYLYMKKDWTYVQSRPKGMFK